MNGEAPLGPTSDSGLPASGHVSGSASKKPRAPPLSYASRSFYQVMPVSEILYRVPVFPADIWDIEDPAQFVLAEHGWGL